jgi:hypothetical protein
MGQLAEARFYVGPEAPGVEKKSIFFEARVDKFNKHTKEVTKANYKSFIEDYPVEFAAFRGDEKKDKDSENNQVLADKLAEFGLDEKGNELPKDKAEKAKKALEAKKPEAVEPMKRGTNFQKIKLRKTDADLAVSTDPALKTGTTGVVSKAPKGAR